MFKRRRKKLKIFNIFRKSKKNKRAKTYERLEITNYKKKDTPVGEASSEVPSAANTYGIEDNDTVTNSHKISMKPSNKYNSEYVEKVRSQVKEVLQEKYDDDFENLFNQFENDGFINKDYFLFRLIFMILKKYSFIDIFDENGEIDLDAIDEILKSIIKDAYKYINENETDNVKYEYNNENETEN